MENALSIRFLGAAGTVTGSKYLVEGYGKKILIDCGLFQGVKQLRLLNREPLPIEPSSIDAVILTHAHLDHTGYLPVLVKNGFAGRIFATPPTAALTELILRDSAVLQEEEADLANEGSYSHHAPALPLYTPDDVERALLQLVVRDDGKWIQVDEGIRFRYRRNGHILGAAFVELNWRDTLLVFSGDVGRPESLLLPPPEQPEEADILVVESTYGDRLHVDEQPEDKIARIVNDTYSRGGSVIIPSFAVGRAQELMILLNRLRHKSAIPDVPVLLDSPMGIEATEILRRFPDWHVLPEDEEQDMWKDVTMIRRYRDTLDVLRKKGSCIVIAGSGMVTGGRVLSYLEKYLEDRRSSVLLAGYQAEGTRGRQMLDGAHEVKIRGKYYRVYAELHSLQSLSAHADQAELLHWMSGLHRAPAQVFIVHGEAQAADTLRVKIQSTLGWNAQVPVLYGRYPVQVEGA
jgi:metallo-beta-lactamase family protein